ncbi:MAG: hypothetical protein D6800_01255 [Candidatus Zixiibacteriota bacterium]|nr:MAG: hypothetical protein D6800_01255 [candidate division Zixibacteria bacterium]
MLYERTIVDDWVEYLTEEEPGPGEDRREFHRYLKEEISDTCTQAEFAALCARARPRHIMVIICLAEPHKREQMRKWLRFL